MSIWLFPLRKGSVHPTSGSGQLIRLVAMVPGVLDLIEKKEQDVRLFWSSRKPLCSPLCILRVALGWLGDFQEGERFLEKGLRHATRIGDVITLATVELFYADDFSHQGGLEGCGGASVRRLSRIAKKRST